MPAGHTGHRTATGRYKGLHPRSPWEAAHILGVRVQSVYTLVQRGRLTHHGPSHARRSLDLTEVEARSLSLVKRIQNPPHPYWATIDEAATMLGVARQTVRNMMAEDRLPSEVAASGRRYIRRHQLYNIANAREGQAWLDAGVMGEAEDEAAAVIPLLPTHPARR